MINFKKEKLIKKHLGINTPDWIVQNCIKMLNEFEDIALTIHDVSNLRELLIEYEEDKGTYLGNNTYNIDTFLKDKYSSN